MVEELEAGDVVEQEGEDISVFLYPLLLLSFLLVVMVSIYIIYLGSVNDLGLSPLNTLIENLNAAGSLPNEAVSISHAANAVLIEWLFHIDEIWLVAYVAFSMLLFGAAYQARRLSLFSFVNIIYIIIMFFLFLLDVIMQINSWLIDNFLLRILPTAETLVPKFLFFLANIGIILSVQLVLVILINVIDFDFAKFSTRKRKENILKEEVL